MNRLICYKLMHSMFLCSSQHKERRGKVTVRVFVNAVF